MSRSGTVAEAKFVPEIERKPEAARAMHVARHEEGILADFAGWLVSGI
jgi:hypothetical protein